MPPQYGLLGGANFDYDQALKMLEAASQSETQRNTANQQIAAQNRAAKGKLYTTAASPFVNMAARPLLAGAKSGAQAGVAKAMNIGAGAPSVGVDTAFTPGAAGVAGTETTTTGAAASPPLGAGLAPSAATSAAPTASASGLAAGSDAAASGAAAGDLAAPAAASATPVATDAAAEGGAALAGNAGDFSAGPYGLIPAGIDLAAHAAGLKGTAMKAVDVGAGAASGALAGATAGSVIPGIGTAIGGAGGALIGAAASYFA